VIDLDIDPYEDRSLLDLEAERAQAEDTLTRIQDSEPYAAQVVERHLDDLRDEIRRRA